MFGPWQTVSETAITGPETIIKYHVPIAGSRESLQLTGLVH